MSEYNKLIIDLNELPIYKFIEFLRVEILDVQGHGPTFFGQVRYARNGVEQDESLPMDLSKGIFIATLRDEQLQGIQREELEKTLQEAAVDITKIVRKHPNLNKPWTHYSYQDNEKQFHTNNSDDTSVNVLKNILNAYPYLKYDERGSDPPEILRCRVKGDFKYPRHVNDIFEIVQKLKNKTGEPYSVGSYGGSFDGGENLDKVWTRFSLRKFDFDDKLINN